MSTEKELLRTGVVKSVLCLMSVCVRVRVCWRLMPGSSFNGS